MPATAKAPAQVPTPKGKRTWRTNVWGNVVGYVSGRRFWEFGTGSWAALEAKRWADGGEVIEFPAE